MRFPRFYARVFLALLAVALWGPGARAADDTIKIGYIDPFSGAFAAGGDASLKMFQFIIDNINAKGGALGKKFELVTFDDKLQPAEALIALKSVTDQNMPFVMSLRRVERGLGADRCGQQAQYAQPRQPCVVAELRRSSPPS